ncbi:hypothetical protein FIT78_05350 [Candidatus Methylopumilus universalis]|uniref:hypothetical protein n=1 Tax=Candidatus Methylopumilus universalis TaxID=2588536 RepID=UPI00111F54D5|nr:hypothetical protein [Candidatus Methylopumilus universalis]QDC98012.1 hypothetical protein FIT78_05350 [Candidatus Methylopumilus universalis]
MIETLKRIIYFFLLFSLSLNADTNKDPIALVTVLKPELESFSTTGLFGQNIELWIGNVFLYGLTQGKDSKDFNALIPPEEILDLINNQIKSELIASGKFNVIDKIYIEDNKIQYEDWLDKKDRTSKNRSDYICEIGIGKILLKHEDTYKFFQAEFALKIINKNQIINTQKTQMGIFWERVEGIEDKNDTNEVKKAYLETLNKLSKKLAKELVDKI